MTVESENQVKQLIGDFIIIIVKEWLKRRH